MTVDCHVHVPSRREVWGLPYYPPDDYVAVMDRLGVDTSVLLPFDGLYHHGPVCNDEVTNNEVAQWCAGHPGRLVPFGTVTPRDPGAVDEVDRCVDVLGMRGLKLHPWMQAFHPLDAVMEPVYDRCRGRRLPLLFHDGTPPLSTPLQVAQVAARFPGLVVVLGHGGLGDLYGEAIEAARRYENVWICMTSLHAHAMRRIVARAPRERLLFGSDAGLASVARQTYAGYRWAMLRDLGLADDVYDAIVTANPRRLLGLG